MKKILVVFVAFVISSCSSDDPSGPSRGELANMILERFEEHSAIIDDVVVEGKIITGDRFQVHEMAATVNNRDTYLGLMKNLTADIFNDALEARAYGVSPVKIVVDPTPSHAFEKLRSYLLPYPSGYTGPNPGSGALDLFYADILDKIRSGYGQHILLDSYAFEGSTSASTIDSFEISYPDLERSGASVHDISITKDNGAAIDQAIEDLLATATPDEVVLIGLLLPAINACRESSSYDAMCDELFDFTAEERLEWDRDVRHAAFLAALDFILSEKFDPTNDATASFYVNRQVFDAVMIMTWAKAYDLYK
jgi:hypothetical protein